MAVSAPSGSVVLPACLPTELGSLPSWAGADVVPLTLVFLSDSNAGSRQFVPGWHDWQLHRHLPAGGYPRPLEGKHQLLEPSY